jgi:DeoR/GlpR family transcriptional regulator of sugar metabolism
MTMSPTPPLGRRETMARRLDDGRAIVAAELAAEFGVSEDAIRRDLRALAAAGRCRRVYGGALPLAAAAAPMAVRAGEDAPRKRALARAALGLIRPGELVFLDHGSTCLALAEMLPDGLGITVATSSVAIAAALIGRRGVALILVGGRVDAAIGGCVDATAVLGVQQLGPDRCFLGACAVSVEEGIGVFDADDAAFKRALLAVSAQVCVMATADKLATRARLRVAPLARIGTLVVGPDADPALLAGFAAAGPRILVAGAPA